MSKNKLKPNNSLSFYITSEKCARFSKIYFKSRESYSLQIFAKVNLLHIENDTEKEEIENYKQAEILN